jgi:HEAT repeat protein
MVMALAALGTAGAPARAEDPQAERRADREDERYDAGTAALDEQRWDDAVRAFDEVAGMGGRRADAALYWKAYAQRKAGRTADALTTIAELRRKAPQSRWLKEAQALEMEIRQSSGQRTAPEATADEDLKLIALDGLMQTQSSRAIPLLKEFLGSNRSPKLRERALFVLSQSHEPEALALLVDIARGRLHPDLQKKAIQNLGLFGGTDSRQALSDVYASTDDVAVKKAVLQAFMVSGEKERVLEAARSEKSPELRRSAIHQLGAMGAQEELWQLYRAEADVAVKKEILQGMFIGGGAERLIELARTETQPELRRTVVHNLGLLSASRTGPTLVSMYQGSAGDVALRRAILNGLFIQNNVDALIQIARSEKDPDMRREAVQKLSLMNSKAATDFLMELLK